MDRVRWDAPERLVRPPLLRVSGLAGQSESLRVSPQLPSSEAIAAKLFLTVCRTVESRF